MWNKTKIELFAKELFTKVSKQVYPQRFQYLFNNTQQYQSQKGYNGCPDIKSIKHKSKSKHDSGRMFGIWVWKLFYEL
ncbi:hypothetical protein DU53_06850 [Kosmotoga sp. DU53]|nr:hypothetical protein DU53_06850 [Kosmotoga sp. DU53]